MKKFCFPEYQAANTAFERIGALKSCENVRYCNCFEHFIVFSLSRTFKKLRQKRSPSRGYHG